MIVRSVDSCPAERHGSERSAGAKKGPGLCLLIRVLTPLSMSRRLVTVETRSRGLALFPSSLTSMLDSNGQASGDVVERPFRGAHSDVGGGYFDNDELARVPLGWMANEAIALGVPIAQFAPNEVTATPNLVQHDSLSVIEKAKRLIGIKPKRKIYYQP